MTIIKTSPFGSEQALAYELVNQADVRVTLTNFGARLVRLTVPLADGDRRNLILSYQSDQDYLANDPYVGAVVGPVAGRIGGGWADINGKRQHFTQNDGNNTLHGGKQSYHLLYWQTSLDEVANKVIFSLELPDGYNGFPGPITLMVSYQLTEANELIISYKGNAAKDTLLNPTNHVYFNLTGNPETNLAGHQLQIQADSYLPLDDKNLPTGDFASLTDTPFDFRQATDLVQGLRLDHPQTKLAQGFDHAWLLDQTADQQAVITSPDGQVGLALRTDASSLVIYTYNFKDEQTRGIVKHGAFSLETQEVPNACHIPSQADKILLKKGQTFSSQTTFKLLI